MDNIRHAIVTFCKAQLSAWIATAVDYTITIILAEVAGIWYGYATFIGALSGGIINCIINYKWVFKAHDSRKRNVALKYFIVWGVSIILNTTGTCALKELASMNLIIAKAIVSVAVAVLWNYQMQRLFVFNTHKK
jgi:putative flippase GtrA